MMYTYCKNTMSPPAFKCVSIVERFLFNSKSVNSLPFSISDPKLRQFHIFIDVSLEVGDEEKPEVGSE